MIDWGSKSSPDKLTSKDNGLAQTLEADSNANIASLFAIDEPFTFPDVLNFYCSLAKPNAFIQRMPVANFKQRLESTYKENQKIVSDSLYLKENAQFLDSIATRLAEHNLIAFIDFDSRVNFIYRKPRKLYVVMRSDMDFNMQLMLDLISICSPSISIHAVITGGNSFRIINLNNAINQ